MGRAAPPPTPSLSFLRRAGLLSRTSYHQQELFQAYSSHSCYTAFQSHRAGSLFVNGGLRLPFFELYKATSSIILRAKTEPIWTLSEPVTKTSWPPHSRLSFYAVQACFQEHRTINTTRFTRIIVIDLFKSHRASSLFANGGGYVRAFSKLCQNTSSIILPATNRSHMDPLKTRDKDCKWFKHIFRSCYSYRHRPFQTHHAGRWGGYIPRLRYKMNRSRQVRGPYLRQMMNRNRQMRGGSCQSSRYMMNRSRHMRGRVNIYYEPESPSDGGVRNIYDEREFKI